MKSRDIAFALFVNLGAGTNWVGTKLVTDYFPPLFSVGMRFVFLAAMLSMFARVIPGQMRTVFAVAITLGVMQFGTMFVALDLADDVAPIAIANQIYVPFSTILALNFLKERIGLWRASAIAIAFGGVVVMGFDPSVFRRWDALLFVIASAASLTVASIFMRRLTGVKVFEMQFWLALIAAPQMFLLSWMFKSGQIDSMMNAPWLGYGAFIYGIATGSFLFHAGWYYLLRRYPVTTVNPFMLLMPVMGVATGMAVYGDIMTWRIALGGILTFVGVAIIIVRSDVKGGGRDRRPARGSTGARQKLMPEISNA